MALRRGSPIVLESVGAAGPGRIRWARNDHDPLERVNDLGRPRQAGGDAEPAPSGTVGEPGSHVQHPEPQQFRLSPGEVTVQGCLQLDIVDSCPEF